MYWKIFRSYRDDVAMVYAWTSQISLSDSWFAVIKIHLFILMIASLRARYACAPVRDVHDRRWC